VSGRPRPHLPPQAPRTAWSGAVQPGVLYNSYDTRRLVDVSEPAAEMPISEARDHFSELVGRARYGGAVTILTHYGSPAAVVISFEEYQRLKGADVLQLPPEIEHVINESRRDPERDQPRPRRASRRVG
jgi:prevent-host-death family protein